MPKSVKSDPERHIKSRSRTMILYIKHNIYLNIAVCKTQMPLFHPQVRKSRKSQKIWGKMASTIGAHASHKKGTEPSVRKGKRSLLAFHSH